MFTWDLTADITATSPALKIKLGSEQESCVKFQGDGKTDVTTESPRLPSALASDFSQEWKTRLSDSELDVWEQQYSKSVKSDDAQTPVHLWDGRV
jgi:phage terminase small subunit